jgi:putative IMPACT (imprinted ancient) family translation regulator
VVGVIRYFGGTLLGAGGLLRAYGGAAGGALRREEWPRVKIRVAVSFGEVGTLYRLLDDHEVSSRSRNSEPALY